MLTAIILAILILGGGLYLLMRHDRKQARDYRARFVERMEREEALRAREGTE